MPPFFDRADSLSLNGQQKHLRAVQLQLGSFGVAALGGVLWAATDAEATLLVSVGSLLTAALVRVWAVLARGQQIWYLGRAAAESAKTLAWRFAVGGDPLPIELHPEQAEAVLLERLGGIAATIDGTGLDLVVSETESTDWMRGLRSASLAERQATYSAERIDDQMGWYCEKAAWNRRRARLWNLIVVAIAGIGVLLAVGTAVGIIEVDLIGVVSVTATAVVAWFELKRHSELGASYGVAARELAGVKGLVAEQDSEETWRRFVDGAEGSISREHTMWTAYRPG